MFKHDILTAAVVVASLGLGTTHGLAQDSAQRPAPVPSPLPGTGQSTERGRGALTPEDEMFLRKAVAGGHTEVTLAILAQQKSASEPVKQLARRIQKDHEKANAELQAIADKKNVSVDHKTTADQAKLKARLEPLSGAAFDRAYLEAMVEDHQKDTKEFEKQASAGTDPELKAFASRTLPDLQDHLKLATDAQRTVTSSAQR